MNNFIKKLGKSLTNIGIIFVLSMLGALGGQGLKQLRRFVFPLIITLYSLWVVRSWWCLSIYSISGWLSMGYGIPEERGFSIKAGEDYKIVEYSDEGSFLGRLFYKLFKGNKLWTNIFTRGTIGLLLSLSMISVPILTGNWLSYLIGSLNIILVWGLVSHRGFGEIPIKLFGKVYNLLLVDLTTYAITSCGLLIIINYFMW